MNLDDDRADHPGFIRSIHDEIRLVDEALWRGPDMGKTGARPIHDLWFALDTHGQAAPIGSAAHGT